MNLSRCSAARLKVFFLGVSCLLGACGTTPIDPGERAALKKVPRIDAVVYDGVSAVSSYGTVGSTGLAIESILSNMLLSAGGLAPPIVQVAGGEGAIALSAQRGRNATQKFGLPAHTMIPLRDKFVARLKSELGVNNFRIQDEIATIDDLGDTVEVLRKRLGNDSVVLDFTGMAHVVFGQGFRKNYFMQYSARARLIRLQDGKLLWWKSCDSQQGGPDERMSLDTVLENGTVLKKWLDKATDDCAAQLSDHFFGRTT